MMKAFCLLALWIPGPWLQVGALEPDAQAQKQAEGALRETFKADYARKQPRDQRILALKLIDYSSTLNPQDTALRYVALRESRDLYAKSGDWDLALKSAEKIAKAFQMEIVPEKMALLSKLSMGAQGFETSLFANYYFLLASEAIAVDRLEDAMKCLSLSETGAKAAKDTSLITSIIAFRREVESLRASYQKAKAPDTATGEMGRYLCLYKGDWERGLPMLCDIKEESLRVAAMAELAKTRSLEEQLHIADAWWDIGWREKSVLSKEKAQSHACSLYERLSGLNATTQARVDERRRTYEILKLGDRLELVPGVPQRTRGIKVLYEIGDGKAVDGLHFGRPCARTGTPETGPCIYFDISKAWAGKDGFIEITAECYDLAGTVYVNYNEIDSAGKDVGKTGGTPVTLGNSASWRTLQFKMPASGCNNAMHGADFRIVSTAEFYLHRLTIRKVTK